MATGNDNTNWTQALLEQLTQPMDAAQPDSDLQRRVKDAKTSQVEQTPVPQMSEATSLSGPMTIPAELTQAPAGPASFPQVKGGLSPDEAAAQMNQPPRPTIGGLPALVANLINPARGTAPGQPVPTKAQRFESFLTDFLGALSQGLSQEGRGPSSFARGMGAAIQAPYQQQVQQFELGQQARQAQAATQAEQLKAQLTTEQIQQMRTSVPVTMPNGATVYVPVRDAGKVLGSVAGAQGKISAAQIAADNKLSVEEMKANLANGKVVKTLPAKDKDGNIGVMGYNAQGQPIGFMQGALPPSAYMPKTSTTTDYIQTDGGLMAVPKSTTTGVQLPTGVSSLPASIQQKIGKSESGSLPPQVQSARDKSTSGVKQVLGPDGSPIFGKDGPTQITGQDAFGNTIGQTQAGVTLSRKEYDAAQKVFSKDYVEPINRLAKTQAEFESIRDNPNQTGAEKVTALLAAVGISGDALQGKGFRISNEVINEHAQARSVWQSFVQKWNNIAGSGGPITSKQIEDYTRIAQGVVHDSYVQAAMEAKRQGLPVDFLPRPKSQNQKADDLTLRIYADSANGDLQKAHKALMAAGWR